MRISAFFPAHNEEANIEELTRKTVRVLSEICEDYEVIIVNDGSKDRTKEIAENLAKENPNIRVISHEINRGYGAALRTGFYNSRFEWIFFTDGDGQFDVTEIKELIKYTDKADLITGYRIKRQDSFIRKLNAFAWGTLVKLLFGFKVKDVDCAFKLIKKEIIDSAKLESDGALISTELLAKATRMGYKIFEIGVHHYPRRAGTQTGAKLKVILRAFIELFKFYGKLKKWEKN
jgi:glycosyltransferase involved in cell wall biosynthesis